jgi:hypothetical protein
MGGGELVRKEGTGVAAETPIGELVPRPAYPASERFLMPLVLKDA